MSDHGGTVSEKGADAEPNVLGCSSNASLFSSGRIHRVGKESAWCPDTLALNPMSSV